MLEADRVSKTFPGVRALHEVSLRLEAGRLVALLGENGAGKSTLMNVLSGALAPDAGVLRIDGRAVRLRTPREASDAGIGAIHQELSLCPTLSVAENMFLGHEPRTRSGTIDYPRMHREAAALLQRMRLQLDPARSAESLRVGQQQVVEIARALGRKARVLIMDEPTSALSPEEAQSLRDVILDLKRAGVAVVYITHKFEELPAIADDVAVMRDGQLVAAAKWGEMSHDELVRHMIGRAPTASGPARAPAAARAAVLRARGIRLPAPGGSDEWLVDNVSFDVASGEVLAIFGLMGAGRTELLECLFGVHGSRCGGHVELGSVRLRGHAPAQAIRAGMALAPEDRKRDGLVLGMSVHDNAALAARGRFGRFGLLSAAREGQAIRPMLQRLRLKAASQDVAVGSLSGGNQQKIVLAKWLLTLPKVLLLDEPTRGIDVNARAEIYGHVGQLAEHGLAVVLVSSDLQEVLAMGDRILVMCGGRVSGEFDRRNASPEALMQAALPGTRQASGSAQRAAP